MLVACLSGVEPLDSGQLEQYSSVSWPLGSNDAFSSKLSGYVNARFAADIYGSGARIEDDMRLIRELAGVDDELFHKPLGSWPSQAKDALKLAVSLAFEFDVTMVGRVGNWDHRAIHPRAVRLRRLFEERIAGRTLVMSGNGQQNLALDYCDEGLALVAGRSRSVEPGSRRASVVFWRPIVKMASMMRPIRTPATTPPETRWCQPLQAGAC
jgi:ABC-type polysaccharide/polyol phosphate transport system ATPase subunit